jgi:glycine cleavage system H protein
VSVPQELQYTKSHEWVRVEDDVVSIGITDHSQEELGDVVFVELPEPGANLNAGDAFGAIESVKAVSDLYAPVGGEVVEVNGWIVKIRSSEDGELLSAGEYEEFLAEA